MIENVSTSMMVWFISVVVLVMSLVLAMAGAFTMYFGSGRSRKIGGVIFIMGFFIGAIYVLMASSYWPGASLINAPILLIIKETAIYVAAIAVGAVVGIGIFLGAIMKA